MTKRNKAGLAILITLCVMGTQSCKKGCTDPMAYNYAQSAKHDDASCLYCDSSFSTEGVGEFSVQDLNSSSPHEGQTVLYMDIIEKIETYSGNGCQRLGLVSSAGNGCDDITLTAALINQTSSTMVVSGTLVVSFNFGGGTSLSYTLSSVSIPPFGTDSVTLGVTCNNNNDLQVNLTNSSFQYH